MTTTMTRTKAAVALLAAFFLGGVSARVWLAGPAAPPEDAHAERTSHEEQERHDHGTEEHGH
jgi:hypothetical protein